MSALDTLDTLISQAKADAEPQPQPAVQDRCSNADRLPRHRSGSTNALSRSRHSSAVSPGEKQRLNADPPCRPLVYPCKRVVRLLSLITS
jgi:hypothetical protein